MKFKFYPPTHPKKEIKFKLYPPIHPKKEIKFKFYSRTHPKKESNSNYIHLPIKKLNSNTTHLPTQKKEIKFKLYPSTHPKKEIKFKLYPPTHPKKNQIQIPSICPSPPPPQRTHLLKNPYFTSLKKLGLLFGLHNIISAASSWFHVVRRFCINRKRNRWKTIALSNTHVLVAKLFALHTICCLHQMLITRADSCL